MKRFSKIIICRHAESLEDVDNSIYDTMNDLDIPLTEKGILQSEILSTKITSIIKDSLHVHFFASPGVRNRQTLEIVTKKIPSEINYSVTIDPLLVKQSWGKIDSINRPIIEADRYKIGVLRYDFPTGESANSLISRLSKFKEKIFEIQENTNSDIVLFSHGFEFRVFLMIVFGWSEDYFESLGNLKNAEFRILTKISTNKYELNENLRFHGMPVTRIKNS